MKIGIDARLYGIKHRGNGRYTQEVISHLEKIDHENKYFVFLRAEEMDSYQPKNSNFQKVVAYFRAYSWQEQLLFPFLLNKYKLDLVHFMHFNVPLLYRRKFITTIHDLIITHYPTSRASMLNPFLYKIKLFFYNIIISQAASRAVRVITVSNFSKEDIIKTLKIKPEKISVIYEGADLEKIDASDCERVIREIGIKNDFLLYVGAAYPHKNLEKLVLAFDLLLSERSDWQLVLVGKDGYFYQQTKKFAQENLNQENLSKIIFAGYLDDAKLSCLYQKAKLYVFPSLMEGFGLPPLEAQASSLPIVSSNKSCLPEVLGDGALYFDPEDATDIKDKIILASNDESLRQELIQKGLANFQKFSWQKCAQEIISVYSQK